MKCPGLKQHILAELVISYNGFLVLHTEDCPACLAGLPPENIRPALVIEPFALS